MHSLYFSRPADNYSSVSNTRRFVYVRSSVLGKNTLLSFTHAKTADCAVKLSEHNRLDSTPCPTGSRTERPDSIETYCRQGRGQGWDMTPVAKITEESHVKRKKITDSIVLKILKNPENDKNLQNEKKNVNSNRNIRYKI